MLSTGIRTPVGVKVIGKDLAEMEKVARQVEKALKTVEGTSSAYAERVVGGYYLEIVPDRDKLARYGLMVSDVQDVVGNALWRRTHHHHCRRPRTLHGGHPLSARPALRPAIHRQGRAGRPAQRRDGAAGRGGRHPAHPRRHQHPHRERQARHLHLRRHPRPRPRRLRRRRPEGGGRTGASCPPARTWCGAASSNTCNAPKPACRWWCR